MPLDKDIQISDADYEDLVDSYETGELLEAVDKLDELRGDFADQENGAPMEMRDDLLKLHRLAMDMVNNGARHQVLEMFNLAGDLEMELDELVDHLKAVRDKVAELANLRPDYL